MSTTTDAPQLSGSDAWPRALWLGERVPAADRPTPVEDLHAWAEVLDLNVNEPAFAHALGLFDTSPAALRRLAGAQPRPSAEPGWLCDVRAAAGRAAGLPGIDGLGLLTPAGPLIRGFQRELADRVAPLANGRLAGLAAALADAWPAEQLGAAAGPTMVLELNVARVRGELRGGTAQERFADFVARLSEPATAQALWDEYPVLLRYLRDILRGWVESRVEFAGRLAAELPLLDAAFGPPGGLGGLTAVEFGAGDRHCGGRSVAVVRFAGGTVVYKPRSMAADLGWQGVVSWFNASGPRHQLPSPVVVSGQHHGWMEFLAHRPCADEAEAAAFHWRLGALLALLYALRATDMHTENLIATGPQPVLVDLEALFHPTGADDDRLPWADPAGEVIREGVTSVGLLPRRMFVYGEDGTRSLDMTAIGAAERQQTPFTVPAITDLGSDTMRFVDDYVPLDLRSLSRPRIGGDIADPRRYRDDLLAGFVEAYRRIVTDRRRWLAEDGLLAGFRAAPLRYIARPTSYYGRLLAQSLHPDYLRDALDRDRTFLRLCHGADGSTTFERLIGSELADLRAGDIPFFGFRPDSRDLWTSNGERVPGFLASRPMDDVAERVRRLGEADLALQRALIQQSFATLETGGPAAPAPVALGDQPLGAAEALEVATGLARQLCRSAIRAGADLGWVTLRLIDEKFWAVDPAPHDLYTGAPGIGLLLSTTAARSGDGEVTEAALAVAEMSARRCVIVADEISKLLRRRGTLPSLLRRTADSGAFGIFGGMIYYLAHAAAWHERPGLLDAAEALLPVLDWYVENDRNNDLVSGNAGAILSALALHAARPAPATLAVAVKAGERLLAAARPAGDGLGWLARFDPLPLAGMAHGASGVALALARLDQVAPRQAFRAGVAGALRYERSLRTRDGNWPDLRAESRRAGATNLTAWCYGATGVGLARTAVLDTPGLGDLHALAAEDLALAEGTVWSSLVDAGAPDGARLLGMGNDGLCHGTLGNIELALRAARRRGDAIAQRRCLLVAASVLRRADRHGWRTGVPGVSDTPGAMLGMAGIGYQLVAMTDPGVPSLLLLEPPAGGAGHAG